MAFGYPATTAAHHTVSELGIAWTEPVSYAEVRVQGAKYEQASGGRFALLTVGGEWSPHRRVSFGAQIPFALVYPSTGGSDVGLSDIVLSARAGVLATEHGEFLLSAGVAAELPTGNESAGLGGGHLEFSPFVAFSSSLGTRSIVAHGFWADGFSIGAKEGDPGHGATEDDGHAHSHGEEGGGSVVAPHAAHEASLRHGLTLTSLGRFYVGLRNEVALKWSEASEDLLGPVTVGTELGWNPANRWRVSVGADLPVTTERRYAWMLGLGSAVVF